MEISLSEIRELSIKYSRRDLTQKEITRILEYFFEVVGKIPTEELLKELLTDAETLTETVAKLRILL